MIDEAHTILTFVHIPKYFEDSEFLFFVYRVGE